jgi:hypothetical protein
VFPRNTVCLRNISADTPHKGDTNDDDDDEEDDILNPNDNSALFFIYQAYAL